MPEGCRQDRKLRRLFVVGIDLRRPLPLDVALLSTAKEVRCGDLDDGMGLCTLAGLPCVGTSARRLLRRVLLGSDGIFVCRRGDECALLSLLVLLEKLTPFGRWVARAAGLASIAAGAWMLLFFGQ